MSPPLILVPTALERKILQPQLVTTLTRSRGVIELCGFGPVAAAARTAQLIERYQSQQVLLVGIAGALDQQAAVGAAYQFDQVALYGVGAGAGEKHQTASEFGWHHWDETDEDSATGPTRITDVITLETNTAGNESPRRQLLTACSASADEEDVRWRRTKFPDAVAEDMEGFAVALACQLTGRPLQIVRGISNRAGDRDKRNWMIEEALHAAAGLTAELLAAE